MTQDNAVNGDLQNEKFWKSSFSGNAGCVEVSLRSDGVYVRDSKESQGAILTFTHHEWSAFVLGVRAGEFDKPRE